MFFSPFLGRCSKDPPARETYQIKFYTLQDVSYLVYNTRNEGPRSDGPPCTRLKYSAGDLHGDVVRDVVDAQPLAEAEGHGDERRGDHAEAEVQFNRHLGSGVEFRDNFSAR